MADYGAERKFGGPVQFQCANAFPASANLANGFVVTALGTVTLADMISIGATPGFDPGQRRIFVKFEQQSPPNFLGQNPIPLLVGRTSVAPRAQ